MANLLFDGFEVLSKTYLSSKWDINGFGNGISGGGTPARSPGGAALTKTSQSFADAPVRSIGSNVGHIFIGVAILSTIGDQPSTGSFNNCVLFDGATAQVSWRVNANGSITVYRGQGTSATVIGTTATGLIFSSSLAVDYKMVEMEVVFATGATGSVTLRVGDTQVLNVTSVQTSNTANAYCNRFGLQADQNMRIRWDDLYINDDSGSSPHNTFYGEAFCVEPSVPNAAGTSTQFSRNTGATNFGAVDDSGNDDTDYVFDSVVGDKDSYNMGNLATSSGTIVGVEHWWIAKKDDIISRTARAFFLTNSSTHNLTTRSMTGSYQIWFERFTQNPITAAAWTISEINAIENGLEIVT